VDEFYRGLQGSLVPYIAKNAELDDQPAVPLPTLLGSTASMHLEFKDYLRFRPSAGIASDNIFVTITGR
jgi:hypothetical protein